MLCLTVATDDAWAHAALREPDDVLVDHAHCEMKAASNALSLAARHPTSLAFVRAMTDLAREEIDHFQRVVALLESRGATLGPPPVDAYAAELRRAANDLARDSDLSPLVDRLLVGALIEARSCERFKLLAEACTRQPALAELGDLWAELLASEARHYRTFVDLAVGVAEGAGRDRVLARLGRLAAVEGAIVASLSSGAARASIHG
jgi:tRNA-(ms[2]io[6]A)-hydroxylase